MQVNIKITRPVLRILLISLGTAVFFLALTLLTPWQKTPGWTWPKI